MSVSFLTSRLRSTEDWRRLTSLLDKTDPISLLGTPGLLSALLVAEIQTWKKQRVVVVCADPDRARHLRGDLEVVLGTSIGLFAPYDHYFFRDPEQNIEARWERLRALEQLYLRPDDIQITSIQSLLYPIVSRETLGRHVHRYTVGEAVDFSGLVETMVSAGFERQPVVEEIGDLSVRGGLLDIYPPTLDYPVRIEFEFDTISSIRSFDPTNQRSVHNHDDIAFMPPIMDLAEGVDTLEGHSLLDHLDDSVCVILDEPLQYERKTLDELSQLQQHLEEGAGNGTEHGYGIASEADAARLQQRLRDRSRIYFSWNAVPDTTVLDFKGVDPPSVRRDLRALSKEIRKFQANRKRYSIRIYCDNQGQVERLQDFFDEEENMETPPVISVGEFSGGFILPKARLAIFLDHQIFLREQVQRRRTVAGRRKDSLFRNQPLTFGDYVVHEQYGIGKYMGLFHITVNEAEQECLKIQYKGGDTLFVSIDKLSYLERFSSQEGVEPKLSSLGTTEWERTKARTRKAIKSIAKDLLQIYAARKMKRGHAFNGDTQWQRELEASFPYEETADQLQVIAEIKRDM